MKGQILTVDANASGGGSSGQELRVPPEADSKGLFFIIYNNGEEVVTIKDDAGSITLATLAVAEAAVGEWALCWCDGSATTTDSEGIGDVGWKAQVFAHALT